MIEHFRNFGAMTTAREFWGGNNGFVTIALTLPADVSLPVGTDYEAAKKKIDGGISEARTDSATYKADIRLVMNAERNLFNLAQALGQRAVVVAVSELEEIADVGDRDSSVFGDLDAPATGVLARGESGITDNDAMVAVTFLIERADVLTAQLDKPGTNGASVYSVAPAQDIADMLAGGGVVFSKDDTAYEPNGAPMVGSSAPVAATGALVKVFDALPVLK